MRGKASANFSFDADPERTLRARLRQAKREKLELAEKAEEEVVSVHSENSDSEAEITPEVMAAEPPPPERLLGDYGGTNTAGGRMTIVNQPVNVEQFQLHPSTINQLGRRSFSGRVNEDANKHLQRFLTMSTTLKMPGHSEEEV